jgi:hypothetical protein
VQAYPAKKPTVLAVTKYDCNRLFFMFAEDEIDTLDPLVGGSFADPMSPAKSGGFLLEVVRIP